MSPIDSKNIFLFSSNNSSSCFVISVSNALKFNNQTPDYYAPKANPIFLTFGIGEPILNKNLEDLFK